jgi:hypothetical protein
MTNLNDCSTAPFVIKLLKRVLMKACQMHGTLKNGLRLEAGESRSTVCTGEREQDKKKQFALERERAGQKMWLLPISWLFHVCPHGKHGGTLHEKNGSGETVSGPIKLTNEHLVVEAWSLPVVAL